MNNLEICKRIAEIEGVYYIETKGDVPFLGLIEPNDFTGTPPELIGEYNPLTDKALCFDLMVKYKVVMAWLWDELDGTPHYDAFISNGNLDNDCFQSKNPNKAICLAIIEAHS